tara:strand:+ start:145 stop:432 length:288 start_codon:yes stop_codon:yes gene_type:complete
MEGIYYGYFNLASRQQELNNQSTSHIISRSSITSPYSDSKINTVKKSSSLSPTSSANSSSSSLNLKITEKTQLISNNQNSNDFKGALIYNKAYNP